MVQEGKREEVGRKVVGTPTGSEEHPPRNRGIASRRLLREKKEGSMRGWKEGMQRRWG